jgi:hypothetical protein
VAKVGEESVARECADAPNETEEVNYRGADRNSPAVEQSQSPVTLETDSTDWTRRWPGWIVLWAGWLIPQFVLLGPALIGRTVDIPVDLLAFHSIYLPERADSPTTVRHGVELTDLLFCYPEGRDFLAKELRAGRLPTWNRNNFAGAPFVGSGYSPFEIPYQLAPYPITVAWISLIQSVTLGFGMWLFLRRSLNLSYWAAALASWCVPLTGFMTLWHGFSTVAPACWLPWLLVAVDGAVKNPRGWASLAVAVLTALVLLAGHIGIAGLVLLTVGFYAVWLLSEAALQRDWQRVMLASVGIGVAWLLGFAVSAAALVPLVQYVRTGARQDSHAEGLEERPPEGLEALPAIVRPDVYGGRTRANWARTVNSGLIESSSSAYAGLLAALWLAPLAWFNRRLRSKTIFVTLLVVLSLGWTLNVPGIVDFLRSRPMRPLLSLSYNRWVFATSDAILLLAAIGLDALRVGTPRFRWWWSAPMLVTAFFGCWCIYRLFTLTRKLDEVGFSSYFLIGAGLSLVALVGWAMTFRTGQRAKWVRIALIVLLPLELIGFAWDERRQADAKLYFPRVPILEQLAALPQGRVWGVACLPPNLNQMCGLEDVRGYDAVDPRDYFRLFELACDRQTTFFYTYARTLAAVPAGETINHTFKLHPVADLLNVRYVIFREPPRSDLPILLHQDDYWIMENRNALPRTYVPLAARVVKNDDEAVSRMSTFDFDPRKTVLMTDDLKLPQTMRGTASVRYEAPTRTLLEVEMQTAGLVLLSDSWAPGWRAELDGTPCPIYRVDIALCGFQVPAGKHSIVCVYHPASVRQGFEITGTGGAVLLLWAIGKGLASRRARFAVARI